MGLNDGAIEGEGAEVEGVKQAFNHCGPSVTLKLSVANVVTVSRGPEKAVDSAGVRLRRVPVGETLVAEPDATVRQLTLHVREVIEMVRIPDVEIRGRARFE